MFRVPEDDPHDIAPLVGQVSVETVKIAAGLPGEFAA
jgi:hypothetical protein